MKTISGLLLFHTDIIFFKVPNQTFIGGYFMIVKNLLVVGVVAGFATAAAAQDSKGSWSVGGKVRVDVEQSSTEDAPNGGTKTTSKSSEVSLNRAQFTLTGTRGSDSINMTYYADSNELYSAFISHKVNDMITAHFGKMKVLAQSVENSYDAIDQYDWSWAAMHAPMNSTGARLDFALAGDHNVSVQAVEGVQGWSNDVTVNGKTTTVKTMFNKSGGLTTALQYRGNVNGIKPIISYTQVRTSSTKGSTDAGGSVNYGNGYQTQMGVGAQASFSGANVELEYDTVKFHKQKDVAGAKDNDIASMIAHVRYPVGKTTPFLKVASESWKFGAADDIGDMKGMNLSLGVEHSLDDSCRLHAVYMNQASTEKNAQKKDDKTTVTGFNFGVTASM
jgi:hypothetical protein